MSHEGMIDLAVQRGYLKRHGGNKYTITEAGQQLVVDELSKRKHRRLAVKILKMPPGDEQGTAFITVLTAVLGRRGA